MKTELSELLYALKWAFYEWMSELSFGEIVGNEKLIDALTEASKLINAARS